MSNNEKGITLEELEKEILKKAREDKDFKIKLFDNPKETLEQFGVKILVTRVSDAVKTLELYCNNATQMQRQSIMRLSFRLKMGECSMNGTTSQF